MLANLSPIEIPAKKYLEETFMYGEIRFTLSYGARNTLIKLQITQYMKAAY